MASIRKRTWKSAGEDKTAWIADYFDRNVDAKHPNGHRHIKTFATKKAADVWLLTTRREVQEGVHTPTRASITVAAAGEAWIAQAETDGLERSTLMQYRQHLDYHINPFLGAKKLADLTPGTPRSFRNDLIRGADGRDPRSPTMAKKVVSSLGAILANAMADRKVARNVVREQGRDNQRRARRLEKRHGKRLEVGSIYRPKTKSAPCSPKRRAAGARSW